MNIAARDIHKDARERAYSIPLDEIDVADPVSESVLENGIVQVAGEEPAVAASAAGA